MEIFACEITLKKKKDTKRLQTNFTEVKLIMLYYRLT